MMKRICTSLAGIILLASCNNKEQGKFILNGELKNTPDQKVYLEQVFFSQKGPEVLDTAEIKNGKFSVSGIGNEEGLYRLRFEKQRTGYLFINDADKINFKADANDMSITGPDFNTAANQLFKNFLVKINDRQNKLRSLSQEIDSLRNNKGSDSLIDLSTSAANTEALAFKNFIIKSVDTLSDPVVAIFALGYTGHINPAEIKTTVSNLAKRFPEHRALASVVTQFNEMVSKADAAAQAKQQASANSKIPGIGDMAPEITLPDTSGKSFSLSSLRGKYVLIDFWASWCGPCRGENPNVVANYNKFKDKNFTILGVSLDENKKDWIKAINRDHLSWMQVSDLKYWNNAAVALYGFDTIPYNVLIDPTGKIIAVSITGDDLGKKLSEVLK